MSAPEPSVRRSGRYDEVARRHGKRQGRQRGCDIYIPAVELERAGFDPDGPVPYYRVWGSRRGSVLVRLYKEA